MIKKLTPKQLIFFVASEILFLFFFLELVDASYWYLPNWTTRIVAFVVLTIIWANIATNLLKKSEKRIDSTRLTPENHPALLQDTTAYLKAISKDYVHAAIHKNIHLHLSLPFHNGHSRSLRVPPIAPGR